MRGNFQSVSVVEDPGQMIGELLAQAFENRFRRPALARSLGHRVLQEDPQLTDQQGQTDQQQSPGAVAARRAGLGLVELAVTALDAETGFVDPPAGGA